MAKFLVDIHVHFGAPGDPEKGDPCYWSKAFTKTPAYKAFRLVSGTWLTKLDLKKAKEHVIKIVEKSDKVGPCVLLAMDMVYDKNGDPHLKDRTQLYVSNELIADLAHKRPDLFLFGASIHPFRRDWDIEIDKCVNNNAALCKWIPSAQQIDMTDPKCERFYRKLAKVGLPLLCHAGPEKAIITADSFYDQFNNPKHLEKALDMGVTVIVPHCVLPFPPQDLETFEPHQELLRLLRLADDKNWNLYVDVSALFLLRNKYIPEVKNNIPAKRMLFGSDYPIPMFDFSYKNTHLPWEWLWRVSRSFFESNLLDKNYYQIEDTGIDPIVFMNANRLFSKHIGLD